MFLLTSSLQASFMSISSATCNHCKSSAVGKFAGSQFLSHHPLNWGIFTRSAVLIRLGHCYRKASMRCHSAGPSHLEVVAQHGQLVGVHGSEAAHDHHGHPLAILQCSEFETSKNTGLY